jgi:hypothetical protein
MSTLQIGKPNYNRTNSEKLVYYRLGMKDNQRELTLFICPPIKSMAEDGAYATYVKQHFGYTLPGKGDKPYPKTFNCIEKRDKGRNVTQECPECNEIDLRKKAMEATEVRLKAANSTPEIIEAHLRPMKAWLKEHNCDKKWNLLAKNEANVWGILALSHTAFKDFQREIADLRKAGIEDPIGVTGCWWRFTRTGTSFNDITDTCKAVQEKSGKSFMYKEATMTDSDFQALEAMPELTSLGTKISYEQIKMLVESGGDEAVVKSVFASSQRSETSAVRTSPVPSQVQVAPSNPVVSGPIPQLPPVVPSASALQAQLAAAQAAVAALQKQAATPNVSPQPGPSITTQLDMDPEEFMAKFGQT